MNEEKIKKIIEDIDIESANHNAKIKLVQYGGVDEIGFEATKNGFVRFGLLILKMAYTKDKKEQRKIVSDIAQIVSNDSDYYFSWLELKEQIEDNDSSYKSSITDYIGIFITFILLAIIVVGFVDGIRIIFNFIM